MAWFYYPGDSAATYPSSPGHTKYEFLHKVFNTADLDGSSPTLPAIEAGDVLRIARVKSTQVPLMLDTKIRLTTAGDLTTDLSLRIGLAYVKSDVRPDAYPFETELPNVYRDYFCTINNTGVDAAARMDITADATDSRNLVRAELATSATSFAQIYKERAAAVGITNVIVPPYFDIVIEFVVVVPTTNIRIVINGILPIVSTEFDPIILGEIT